MPPRASSSGPDAPQLPREGHVPALGRLQFPPARAGAGHRAARRRPLARGGGPGRRERPPRRSRRRQAPHRRLSPRDERRGAPQRRHRPPGSPPRMRLCERPEWRRPRCERWPGVVGRGGGRRGHWSGGGGRRVPAPRRPRRVSGRAAPGPRGGGQPPGTCRCWPSLFRYSTRRGSREGGHYKTCTSQDPGRGPSPRRRYNDTAPPSPAPRLPRPAPGWISGRWRC